MIVYDINTWRHNIIVHEMKEVEGINPKDEFSGDISIHLYSPSEDFDDSEITVLI